MLDLVIAVTAIFISAVSLFVAIEHGRTERDLVAANSWPFVQLLLSNAQGEAQDIVFGASNAGVGPAKIKSLEVFFDGKPVSSNRDILRRCCGFRDDVPQIKQLPQSMSTSLIDETVLRAGADNAVLTVRRSPSAPAIPERFAASLTRLSFRTCYCSVLDECSISDLKRTEVERVEKCPIPDHPFAPNGR